MPNPYAILDCSAPSLPGSDSLFSFLLPDRICVKMDNGAIVFTDEFNNVVGQLNDF